jgi:hypothetical protein
MLSGGGYGVGAALCLGFLQRAFGALMRNKTD